MTIEAVCENIGCKNQVRVFGGWLVQRIETPEVRKRGALHELASRHSALSVKNS